VHKKRNKRKKIRKQKNKSTQAQVTQLTQAVLAQENTTIESILFFTQRMQRKRLRAFEWNPGLTVCIYNYMQLGYKCYVSIDEQVVVTVELVARPHTQQQHLSRNKPFDTIATCLNSQKLVF